MYSWEVRLEEYEEAFKKAGINQEVYASVLSELKQCHQRIEYLEIELQKAKDSYRRLDDYIAACLI